MKNKYLEQLKEDGFFEEFDEDTEEEPDELLPYDEAEDREELPKTVRAVISLMLILSGAELLVILLFIGGSITQWSRLKTSALLGLLIGSGIGIGLFLTMKNQIEDLMYLPEERANKKIRTGYMLRLAAVGAAAAVGGLTGFFHPVTVVIGVFNVKPASFLCPFFRKMTENRQEKR